MSVPGVGVITATAFIATIDDPARLKHSASVGAYLGLTPQALTVGDDGCLGAHLESRRRPAAVHPVRGRHDAAVARPEDVGLEGVGVRLAKRVGYKKARVAIARKLDRMWADKAEFRAMPDVAAAA